MRNPQINSVGTMFYATLGGSYCNHCPPRGYKNSLGYHEIYFLCCEITLNWARSA